jgi:nicotinamidase-related amidase
VSLSPRAKAGLLVGAAIVALLAAYAVVFVPFGPTSGPPIEQQEQSRTALLVLDLQVDFLADDGNLPVARGQVPGMLDAVARLLQRSAELGLEVVYVKNAFSQWDVIGNLARNRAAIAGEPGAEIDPRVQVLGSAVFDKTEPDAFSNAALDTHLRQHKIDHLLVAGVFADQCVRSTALGALNRKYEVTIVEDGIAAATDDALKQALAGLASDGAAIAQSSALIERLAARQ